MKEPDLDTCGCCESGPERPRIRNRPGLPALRYRVGTHGSFCDRMLRCLSAQPALEQLTVRSTDDPAIALLDSAATVLDVLTFYQERIANEGYVGTATERRSVLELARAISYELSPGAAAATFLAFTVEDAPGAPGRARIVKGLPVSSIPGQDETPQTFETAEEIEARAEWNVLRPLATRTQALGEGTTEILVRGIDLELRTGDAILIVGAERKTDPESGEWRLRTLTEVDVLAQAGLTRAAWRTPLKSFPDGPALPADPEVFVLRQRAALFGHNAPDWKAMPNEVRTRYAKPDKPDDFAEWPGLNERPDTDEVQIDLDAVYPKILPGSWLVLQGGVLTGLFGIEEARITSRTDFTLSSKTTRLTLDRKAPGVAVESGVAFERRDTVVLAQAEPLDLADVEREDPVGGGEVVLDRLAEGLPEKRLLVFSGVFSGPLAGGETEGAEGAVLREAVETGGRTKLVLEGSLKHSYDRAAVRIYANVARATHGETVEEPLGSGDGARPHQRFRLGKPPLTHLTAPTASGLESTLEVRVNDILWREVPSLFGLDAESQSYVVRLGDDAGVELTFGDGVSGSRLPTGTENVVATYRSGIGPEGEVAAGSLTLLPRRPLGIREVTNPSAATGAAPPESLEEARVNAPRRVLTLDRIVSLRDFEDFAAAYPGIGKALATDLRRGEKLVVHVTVAGVGGRAVENDSALYRNLVAAIDAVRDPAPELQVESYEELPFRLEATVRIDPRFRPPAVLERVEAALGTAFSFERRRFGQPVTAAEVVAEIQRVEGVVAVDLDRLYRKADPFGPGQTTPPPVLRAEVARRLGPRFLPAQLLLLDRSTVSAQEAAP